MFTVHVSAVVDKDWGPGINTVTCLQGKLPELGRRRYLKAPGGSERQEMMLRESEPVDGGMQG